MKVRWIQPGATLGAQREEVVVCIPVYGGHEHFVSCLRSVLMHTPAEVRIMVCDDASPDTRSVEFVRKLETADTSEHEIFYLRRERNVGFPANANDAMAMAAPADVVLLNSDCAVGAQWLEGLRDAAGSDSRVATATALTNNGSIVSVPDRGVPQPRLPEEWNLDDAAAVVRARSLRLRPRLPTAIGHCVLIRRSALELVGDFDLAFTPGYGEEVDFSQRCLHRGLSHVVADEVFVFHAGGASFSLGGVRNSVQDAHERMLKARYPYYHAAVKATEEDVVGPLPRALSVARRALRGLSVLIDARVLAGPMTGTQLQILEVISGLARAESVRLSVVVPENLSGYAAATLDAFPAVRVLTRDQLSESVFELVDLVHRPYQINSDEDLVFLARLGERLMVTNQDLIGYHNPAYFSSFEKWQGYRRLTRSALAVADRVVFLSAHAREDALAEDLVEPARASVVHNGVDHTIADGRVGAVAPRGSLRLPAEAEAILCLGTDFRHKNRIFALRLLEQLRSRHDWPGYLLLAGPRVTEGSSIADEAELLALSPELSEAVIDLAAVSEAEKVWLFQRSGLVLYPTVHEGFGLVPFEAADHGVPCLWAAGTSLREVLPESAAGIEAWDAASSADKALELLRDESARAANVAAIREAAGGLTWDAAVAHLTEFYELTCDSPATPASALERRHGLANIGLSEDAMRLIGPEGALPVDVERPLLALATHPQIGAPMFRAMKFGYRASYALRRRRGRSGGAGASANGEARPPDTSS